MIEFIIFGSRCQLKKLPKDIHLLVGHSLITPSEFVRNLGVIFDQYLAMNKHAVKVCQSSFSNLRLIGRLRFSLNYQTCCTLLHSLVLSKIEYCVATLNGATGMILKRLQRIINASARLADWVRSLCGDIPDNKVNDHWLSVKSRISLRLALLSFNAINYSSPAYLANMICHPSHNRELRSTDHNLLGVTRTRTETGKRSFVISSAHIWNALPPNGRASLSRESFREIVLSFLRNE